MRHARGSQDGPQGQDRRAARPRRARVPGRRRRRARDGRAVYVCGLLAAGTVKEPYESSLGITLAAGDDAAALDEDGIDYGTEAFAVFGGLVFLRGAACPDARVYASRDAVRGASSRGRRGRG